MDIQTKGGKPVMTSENALSPNNFRAYSPQTANHNQTHQRVRRARGPPPVLTTVPDASPAIPPGQSRPVYPASMTVHTTVAVLPPKFSVAKRRASSPW
jgi:hypothetical protein